MKRDMELVRKLLLYFEEKPDTKVMEWKQVTVEGYDQPDIGYHIILLYQASFLDGEAETTKTGRIIYVSPQYLTWEGHEFLAAARNDTLWGKTKARVLNVVGDVPFSILKELLIQAARAQLLSPGQGGGGLPV